MMNTEEVSTEVVSIELEARKSMLKQAAEDWIKVHPEANSSARSDLQQMLAERPRDAADFGELRTKYNIPKPIGFWLAEQRDIVEAGHFPGNDKRKMYCLVTLAKDAEYWGRISEDEIRQGNPKLQETKARALAHAFCESEQGKKIANWLKDDLRWNGPINWSVFGSARFLPIGVSVGTWLTDPSMEFVHAVAQGGGRDFCELLELAPDSRSVRTKTEILPDWMNGNLKSIPFVGGITDDSFVFSGSKPFFVGKVHFKKSPLGFSGQYVVTDVVSVTGGAVSDIPQPKVVKGSLSEGEFVVGLSSNKGPFLFFNQKTNSAVQIITWDSFSESKGGASAEVYFQRNPRGRLTAGFTTILGNEKQPGHVIIVDKSSVYLKGFLSVGNGVLNYSAVEKYSGDFDQVALKNQVSEFKYNGNEFGILVPVPGNEYGLDNKHAVMDCEGWQPLNRSPDIEESLTICGELLQDGQWHGRSELIKYLDERNHGLSESGIPDSDLRDGLRGFVNVKLLEDGVGDWSAQMQVTPVGGDGKNPDGLKPVEINAASETPNKWNQAELEFLDVFTNVIRECGFVYADRDVARLHTSVKCSRMIVLGGVPGVGKSSIIELYARCVGVDDASYLPVAVSPSWAEPADILGDFDLSGKFRNSRCGLAKYIRSACASKQLRAVCFEEMNLACAEHYFSDLMQAVSKPVEDDVDIPGYDQAGFDDNEQAAGPLKMSPNVRVFGTCNFDITTHPFSARFYDRCSYIELSSVMRGFPATRARIDSEKLKCLPSDGLYVWEWKYPESEVFPDVMNALDGLGDYLMETRLYPSPRVLSQMRSYILSRPPIADERKMNKFDLQMRALDEALAQYVFPKYSPDLNQKVRVAQQELIGCVKDRFELSYALLTDIEKRLNGLSVE